MEINDFALMRRFRARVIKGFFYAPVTGQYKFSGIGDDTFALYVTDRPNITFVEPTPIAYQNNYS